MGACLRAGSGALSGRRAFLSGRCGGGECFRGVGAVVDTLFGCQSLPCGNVAAAAVLWMWCSHEFEANVVLTLSLRHPLS